jgi:hypothetical protein
MPRKWNSFMWVGSETSRVGLVMIFDMLQFPVLNRNNVPLFNASRGSWTLSLQMSLFLAKAVDSDPYFESCYIWIRRQNADLTKIFDKIRFQIILFLLFHEKDPDPFWFSSWIRICIYVNVWTGFAWNWIAGSRFALTWIAGSGSVQNECGSATLFLSFTSYRFAFSGFP